MFNAIEFTDLIKANKEPEAIHYLQSAYEDLNNPLMQDIGATQIIDLIIDKNFCLLLDELLTGSSVEYSKYPAVWLHFQTSSAIKALLKYKTDKSMRIIVALLNKKTHEGQPALPCVQDFLYTELTNQLASPVKVKELACKLRIHLLDRELASLHTKLARKIDELTASLTDAELKFDRDSEDLALIRQSMVKQDQDPAQRVDTIKQIFSKQWQTVNFVEVILQLNSGAAQLLSIADINQAIDPQFIKNLFYASQTQALEYFLARNSSDNTWVFPAAGAIITHRVYIYDFIGIALTNGLLKFVELLRNLHKEFVIRSKHSDPDATLAANLNWKEIFWDMKDNALGTIKYLCCNADKNLLSKDQVAAIMSADNYLVFKYRCGQSLEMLQFFLQKQPGNEQEPLFKGISLQAVSPAMLHDIVNFARLSIFEFLHPHITDAQLYAALIYQEKGSRQGKHRAYISLAEAVAGQDRSAAMLRFLFNSNPSAGPVFPAAYCTFTEEGGWLDFMTTVCHRHCNLNMLDLVLGMHQKYLGDFDITRFLINTAQHKQDLRSMFKALCEMRVLSPIIFIMEKFISIRGHAAEASATSVNLNLTDIAEILNTSFINNAPSREECKLLDILKCSLHNIRLWDCISLIFKDHKALLCKQLQDELEKYKIYRTRFVGSLELTTIKLPNTLNALIISYLSPATDFHVTNEGEYYKIRRPKPRML